MNNNDPWAKYQATSTPTAPLPAPASSKRIEKSPKPFARNWLLQLSRGMSDTAAGRLDHLEPALQEVKSQNSALKGPNQVEPVHQLVGFGSSFRHEVGFGITFDGVSGWVHLQDFQWFL